MGYEGQEEGYIAKIISDAGSKQECGKVIGVMVEDKDDIGNVDLSEINNEPPKLETKSEPPAPQKKDTPQVAAAVGTEEFYDQLEKMLHSEDYRVSPAAGWWMRAYMVLPTEVSASGPKGFIQKGDVVQHIDKNNLVVG